MNVRRSSDSTTQDIGFVGGTLDTASLLAFVGAGNGFVTTWYDQSGAVNNVTQATAASQPQIVTSGVVNVQNSKPSLLFSGGQNITAAGGITYSTAAAATLVWQYANQAVNGAAFQIGAINTGGSILVETSLLKFRSNQTGSVDVTTATVYQTSLHQNTVELTVNGASSTNALRVDRASIGTSAATNLAQTNDALIIGALPGAIYPLNGNISELIIFGAAFGTNDRAAIESNQSTYFGTP
jgi:hypothetical protein